MPLVEYLVDLIMNTPPGYEVEFLNGNTLDCRRENLTLVPVGSSKRWDDGKEHPMVLRPVPDGVPVPPHAKWMPQDQFDE